MLTISVGDTRVGGPAITAAAGTAVHIAPLRLFGPPRHHYFRNNSGKSRANVVLTDKIPIDSWLLNRL